MKTIADIYNHPQFQQFGSTGDDWINNHDRMERCHAAAKDGCDGSTHADVIQDWRDFLRNLTVTDEFRDGDLTEDELNAMEEQIDACEKWHEENGTLHEIIGWNIHRIMKLTTSHKRHNWTLKPTKVRQRKGTF